ncbi:HAD family hydrolase [Brevundimonas intermedia]|uniref:HAD family hydrolase n=1 Tax=Brevundimonas intermedia TaxID=74315 RepID=UPI003207F345
MIKAVIFDMDGVLIDAREWHYDALNRALRLFGQEISRTEHLLTFDGLPTRRKLEILTSTRGFPQNLHGFVNQLKQQYTMEIVHARCKPVFAREFALSRLKARGFLLAVASNSVRESVEAMMKRSNLMTYLDIVLSNEDVARSKPDPEIYLAAMKGLGVAAHETLIIEDNDHGVKAARSSGAHVMVVRGVNEVDIGAIDRVLAGLGASL